MATSVEQIVNQALMAARRTRRIADIFEGSEEAKVAIELYGQARDELIDAQDWAFVRRANIPLTLLKGAPPDGGYNPVQPWSNVYPAPGFLFEYVYPDDCIDLRAIIAPPIGSMPDLDPLPELWRIDNDQFPTVSGTPPVASGPQQKVILCNVAGAMAVYRAQVTDPNLWEPGFVAALVASLGKKFARAFGTDPSEAREETVEAATLAQSGAMERG